MVETFDQPEAYFTKEINQSLAKLSLNFLSEIGHRSQGYEFKPIW